MKYTVLYSNNLDHLISAVNRNLADGWQVVGGIAVDERFFLQAMVKQESGTAWAVALPKSEAAISTN